MASVGYCLENDAVAENWCVLVKVQQAAGSRFGWRALVTAWPGPDGALAQAGGAWAQLGSRKQ
jgi:hypothetical protein